MRAAVLIGMFLVATTLVGASFPTARGQCTSVVSEVGRVAAFVGEPVAVITNLPDNVSNATLEAIDGSASSDSDGTIVSYSWKITYGGSSQYLSGISVTYSFIAVGMYQIELTVVDNESKVGKAFEAVNSVADVDQDSLPDWWEIKYFGILRWVASDDPDSDTYTNAQELLDGTDPSHKNAGPSIFSQIPIWGYGAIAAAIAVVLFVLFWPKYRKKQKEDEQKKIQYALEIEKALEEER